MSETKNISYLNKSFSDFKATLIKHAKTYFPTAYNDFSDASPGMMFIEMASYVGDVLSFYLDTQFQENLLLYTKEKDNAISLAYALGYRPKMSYASYVDLQISQRVPIITNILNNTDIPDSNYYIVIPENSVVESINGTKFLTIELVDFSKEENRTIAFEETGYYRVTKTVKAISAEIKTTTVDFGNTPQKFTSTTISDNRILNILQVTDAGNNIWYEVPYLAQQGIPQKTTNPTYNSDSIPYLLSYIETPRRFVTRFKENGDLELQFGAGTNAASDTSILPNPNNLNLGTDANVYDPTNTFNRATVVTTREYGLAPTGVMTIKYLVGGGIASNVSSNEIVNRRFNLADISFNGAVSTPQDVNIFNSMIITNPEPAIGGRDEDTVEEIRQNTLYSFSSQNRVVTKEDYINRVLSMPSHFGAVAKVYAINDYALSQNSGNDRLLDNNPLSISLYVLGYNANKNLVTPSSALKNNIKNYLSQYRMATDAINIKNAYYLNIGINFDISVLPTFNNKEVLSNCINALKDKFSIEYMQINKPLVISDINSTLIQVKGVQSITKVEVVNKSGGSYSPYSYDIHGATRNNILYPSLDPSIFEIRFPDVDIQGRIVTL
jgi:hypothetical protein